MNWTLKLLLICLGIGLTGVAEVTAKPKYPRPSYHPPGFHVNKLPPSHTRVSVRGKRYLYDRGVYYRPGRGASSYVVVQAPIGARLSSLPPGYVSFYIGPRRYYYVNYTYYLWEPRSTRYVVVEEPEGAESALVAASEQTSSEIYVYPKLGQSEEQRDRDRYQCYLWAAQESGFDPASTDQDSDKAGDYRRAISACLEGRGYTVK